MFLFLVIISSIILLPFNAHAYIDPGTGSIVVQALIAGFLGSIFALRTFWGRISAFFSKSSDTRVGHEEEDLTEENK
jgi:hypothetical protein